MADIRNVAAVYQPKTLSELIGAISKNPNAIIIAGGTDILSQKNYYLNAMNRDVISLAGVSELTKVYHGDRFFEAGSLVTIQQLLNTGAYVFSKAAYNAIENIGNSMIRNQATLGGALATEKSRYALSDILSTIGATCEIKLLLRKSKGRVTTATRWTPVSKLYNEDGSLFYAKDFIITRIRIPAYDGSTQVFKILGNLKYDAENAVSFGLKYKLLQTTMTSPSCCIVFPKGGFLMSDDIDELISGISFPINTKQITDFSSKLISILTKECPNVTNLQAERTKRLFETELYKANSSFIAG